MRNISFIGRVEESKLLKKYSQDSCFIVVKGRRRIGKTRLLKEVFPKAKYFFVWPDKSINWLTEKFCEQFKLPKFNSFKDAFQFLLEKEEMVILDEFQNFLNIDKSFYGELQELIDNLKFSKKKFKLIVSGSSYSLLNKVFEDNKSPLYGRRSFQLFLQGLSFIDVRKLLSFASFEDQIKYWSVFNGVPYYYELLLPKNSFEKNIEELFLTKESVLYDEGLTIISLEFSTQTKNYSTIINAIAQGKTTFRELSSYFSSKTDLIKYLNLLRNKFNLIRRETPILSNPKKSKEGIYLLNDKTLEFWNTFVDKQRNYIEINDQKNINKFFYKNYNSFIGRQFEKLVLNLFKREYSSDYEKIGRQWGKYSLNGKNLVYEIDILAVNEKEKRILFCECKWQEGVDAKKILFSLKEKAKLVSWNNEERKEDYVVFAKSFKNKSVKGVKLFNLKDIEKMLR